MVCACARQVWLILAQLNFDLEIKHKPGDTLILADALSRSCSSPMHNKKAQDLCDSLNLECVPFSLDILNCAV